MPVRRSRRMRGRDPALAQTRESMPFWPILASSWKWTSTSPGETSPGIACLARLLKLRRHSSCDSGSACGWMGRGGGPAGTPSMVSRTPKGVRIRARRSPSVQLQCSPASASGPASGHERSVATCPSSSRDGRPVRAAPASPARPRSLQRCTQSHRVWAPTRDRRAISARVNLP